MITGYEIKKINNQEVLYLHLRFDLEFATLNKSKQNKKLQQEIKDYIKTNKINFVGSQIVLMLGGLMLGSVVLNNSGKIENNFITPFNTNNITLLSKVEEPVIPTEINVENELETSLQLKKEEVMKCVGEFVFNPAIGELNKQIESFQKQCKHLDVKPNGKCAYCGKQINSVR